MLGPAASLTIHGQCRKIAMCLGGFERAGDCQSDDGGARGRSPRGVPSHVPESTHAADRYRLWHGCDSSWHFWSACSQARSARRPASPPTAHGSAGPRSSRPTARGWVGDPSSHPMGRGSAAARSSPRLAGGSVGAGPSWHQTGVGSVVGRVSHRTAAGMATPTELEQCRRPTRSASAGSGPHTWQLVLWRFLAFVAHLMRPSAPDERSSMAFHGYLRRHPFRAGAYGVAAWVGAVLGGALLALPVTLLLETLPLRPGVAAVVGCTLVALCGVVALWSAAGRRLRAAVAARVHCWRAARSSASAASRSNAATAGSRSTSTSAAAS